MSRVCCDAGKVAHPDPCPYHPGTHGPDPKAQAPQTDARRITVLGGAGGRGPGGAGGGGGAYGPGAVGGAGGQGGNVSGLMGLMGRSGYPVGSRPQRVGLPQGMGTVVVQGDGLGGQGGGVSAVGYVDERGMRPDPPSSQLTRTTELLIALVARQGVYGHDRKHGESYSVHVTKADMEAFVRAQGACVNVVEDGRGGFVLHYRNDLMEAGHGEGQVQERTAAPVDVGEREERGAQVGARPDDNEERLAGSPEGSATPVAPVVPDHAFIASFGKGEHCGFLGEHGIPQLCGLPKHAHASDWPDHTRAMKVPGAES